MKNREKYKDEIISSVKGLEFRDFLEEHVLPRYCKRGEYRSAEEIQIFFILWLDEEYKEPEVDWTKVEVDTPIMVRDSEEQPWFRKHFAKYEDGMVFTWNLDGTSWSAHGDFNNTYAWPYAKLAEGDE